MDDSGQNRKPKAIYEPGTLDHVRKNIGELNPEEAKRMAKVLGGDIFEEKSPPIDYSTLPKAKNRIYTQKTGTSAANLSEAFKDNKKNDVSEESEKVQSTVSIIRNGRLPEIDNHDRILIDKLMMSEQYRIKPNYGIFNFIRYIRKNGKERVQSDYYTISLHTHIERLHSFILQVQAVVQLSPETYKAKIQEASDMKFKFLKSVSSWSVQTVNLKYLDLLQKKDPIKVSDLVPYVKAIYRMVICVFFIGEAKVPELIKEIFADITKYPDTDRKKMTNLSKGIIQDWLYIYGQILRGMYPLLMRILGGHYENFPDFYIHRVSDILKFVDLTKYSLILPHESKEKISPSEKETQQSTEKSDLPKKEVHGIRDEVVDNGLKLLERLFPQSGFSKIEDMPDMYPYFQPIYEFNDGFNLLSSDNPIQITVVLLKIIEELFQGCRNIQFGADVGMNETRNDSIAKIMDEWSLYREMLFEKNYCEYLKSLSNQLYTQNDFGNTQYGKKIISTLLWQTKYNFLPHFKFDQLILERPADDSPYRPLCLRTEFIRKEFMEFAVSISAAEKQKGKVSGILNPWERYNFDIPNAISKRLDILLGAKRPAAVTAANNANLLKYTLCIVAVLDWWVNNQESPAYTTDPKKIYRLSEKDGAPVFSVPLRTDQDKLFAQSVQSDIQRHKK